MNYRRNHDGYYDPTAGEALEHIVYEERRRLAQKRDQQLGTQPEEQKPRRQRYVNIGRHRRF